MVRIADVRAREVLDSRGKPTVEAEVQLADGRSVSAIAPSGASTGAAEACELRDGDSGRYDGLGVLRAVGHVRDVLGPAVRGLDPTDQAAVDERLLACDPSPRKTQLGGNALLAVSLAAAHAGALAAGVPLFRHFAESYRRAALPGESTTGLAPRMPLPMTNMISGGLHAGGNLDFQDVLVMPVGASHYAEGLEWIVRVYRRLGRLLSDAGYEGRLVGDEGGFGPRLAGNRQAVEFVVRAIEAAGLRPGEQMTIAIDVAATHFYSAADRSYRLATEGDTRLSSEQMIDRLAGWLDGFPIASLEDPLAEDDWDGWRLATERLGRRVRLVGDDLFATNAARIRRGIELGVANSVLIKVNQIGTLSETLRAMHTARAGGYSCVVSARSGETEDATIADLAVGTAADLIKIGAIVRSERLAKYNQLLRIAERLEC